MKEWLVLAERDLKSMSLSDGRRQHHVAESGLRGRLISSTEIANKRRFRVARRSCLARRRLLPSRRRRRWHLKLKRARVLLVQVERRRRPIVSLLLLWRLMLILQHVCVRHVESWWRATDFLLFKLSIFNQSNRTNYTRVLRHFLLKFKSDFSRQTSTSNFFIILESVYSVEK